MGILEINNQNSSPTE